MAGRKQIEEAVAREAQAVLAPLGYELVGVDYYKQEGERMLEVTIYRPEGIDLSDCERATPALSDLLDAQPDLVPGESYNLLVSSPGDRPLYTPRDFERNAGARVEVKLYAPYRNKKVYVGNLRAWGDQIVIEDGGKSVAFAASQVALVRPAFEP